jgi:hypothetical protein
MKKAKLHDDEFMLVRVRDGKRIIGRLFLTETGISQRPCNAFEENRALARSVNGWLESEQAGRVSFGTATVMPTRIVRAYFNFKQTLKRLFA